MNIPRLSMQSTPLKLNTTTQNARLDIESPKGPTLDLRTEQVKVKMQSTQPKLRIDQSQCFAECGIKHIGQFIADEANWAKSKAMEGVGRIVDQGNQLADIAGGDPIPDQAIHNAYGQFVREWNMVTMPRSRPKIDVIPGDVNYTVEGGRVHNNTTYQPVTASYTAGKVNTYVEQYNKLDISVIDYQG